MDQIKIGKLISEKRKSKKLTQDELGKKLGVGGKAVSKWECGITFPDISILKDLSKELDISLNVLLGEDLVEDNLKINKFKKYCFLIISFIILFAIIILFLIFKDNSSYLEIYSKNDIISFKGHILDTEESKVINLNDFKLTDNSTDNLIKEYKMSLTQSQNVLGGYFYSCDEEENARKLSDLLKETIIDISNNEVDVEINSNDLKLVLEYIDEDDEIKVLELEMDIR